MLGGEFCRKLQSQIENAVNGHYNEALDRLNKVLRETFDANQKALDAMSEAKEGPKLNKKA
jgi:BMFP domain-containing protein YqiC